MAEEKQHTQPARDDNLSARVRDLEAQLKAQRAAMPLNLLPENSAGEGDAIAETWSQSDQEAARAGA